MSVHFVLSRRNELNPCLGEGLSKCADRQAHAVMAAFEAQNCRGRYSRTSRQLARGPTKELAGCLALGWRHILRVPQSFELANLLA